MFILSLESLFVVSFRGIYFFFVMDWNNEIVNVSGIGVDLEM